MKTPLAFLLLILNSLHFVNAQSVSWNYTKTLTIPDVYTNRHMLSKKEGGFNVSFYNEPKNNITGFSIGADMKDITSSNRILSKLPPNSKLSLLTKFNGIDYLFATSDTKNSTERGLYVSEFNFKEANIVTEPKLICTKSTPDQSYLDYYFSKDEKSLMVVNSQKNEKEDLPYKINLSVYNENFEELWSKTFPFPPSSNFIKYSSNRLITNNKEAVFVLEEVGEQKRGKRPEIPKNEIVYKLLVCSPDQPNGKIIYLPSDKHILFKTKLIENNEGDLLFLGYYGNEEGKEKDRFDGIFSIKIDMKSKSVVNKEFHEFSNELIFKYTSKFKNLEAENKRGKDNYFNDLSEYFDLVPSPDGGYIMVSEIDPYDYVEASGGWKSITIYHFQDVIVSKLNKDGKVEWETKVPKHQSMVVKIKWSDADDESYDSYHKGKEGSSYNFIVKDGFTYVLYMDTEKNEGIADDSSPSKLTDLKKGKLYATKIAPDGKVISKDLVFDNADEGITFILTSFRNDVEGTLYGLGRKEEDKFFMKFTAK